MGSLQTTLVQVALRRINYVGDGRRTSLHRRPAMVAESGRREHLVMVGEKRDYLLPCVARHGYTVQQHKGRLVRGHEEVWHHRRTANRVSPMKAEPSTPIVCLRLRVPKPRSTLLRPPAAHVCHPATFAVA